MDNQHAFFRWSELDRTSYPEFADRAARFEQEMEIPSPRSYPGYPRWPLVRTHRRLWPSLDRVLTQRRCERRLRCELPSRRVLSRLLERSHAVIGSLGQGPVPSSGGLQSLELYLVLFGSAWVPAGVYHYDRAGHHLSQLVPAAERPRWRDLVPSLAHLSDCALLWVIVGDAARTTAKYGERGQRFLLLEAGHLMQNLCLMSCSLGLVTVPLGGYFERPIALELALPQSDVVLYLGACGKPGGA